MTIATPSTSKKRQSAQSPLPVTTTGLPASIDTIRVACSDGERVPKAAVSCCSKQQSFTAHSSTATFSDFFPAVPEARMASSVLLGAALPGEDVRMRAEMGLAELRRDQGRGVEVHDLLAPIYAWFTEGFDTIDLKAAKLLLAELGA